jgi:cytochrome c biogenesis protein CcmG/thiol:disulfide interchange protein DsbE
MRYAIPGVILVGLLALLGFGLTLNPREVPSPLIGKPVPVFALPVLGEDRTYTQAELTGRPLLVNYWASWCAGCQVEHPLLLRLAREEGVEIVGMDYKDTPEDAMRWLAAHGNPFRTVVEDAAGTAGLDWGVYGVPETFVIGPDGRILHKHIGPITMEAWQRDIRPLLNQQKQG